MDFSHVSIILVFHVLIFSFFGFCFFVLKFIHVVNHDTSMHAVHSCTVAFRLTVRDVHTNTVPSVVSGLIFTAHTP